MTEFSILDLVSVAEGRTIADALGEAASLAREAEALGYKRYWVAEHHLMPGIGGAAVSVVLSHIGNATSTIRIGSGGIMLPNHSPLTIAEQFGTLDALFPGRIDLGLGRAPGADMRVARALRRDLNQAAHEFPQDVVELRAHFTGEPELGLEAVPGRGAKPEMWILGSSLFGAQLAAALGMPYAFASHFAPDALDPALEIYRRNFKPSSTLAQPHVMVAFNSFAAETEAEATYLASSMEQAFVALRTGTPGKLRPPVEGYRANLPPPAQSALNHVLQASAIGTVDQVREKLRAFIERTDADEVIIAGAMFDPEARKRSIALTMEAAAAL
ncbi:MAG: LLM class flavin-dependent oxidoreductase [Sphingorhabdus sp.]